jgi:hypothetical protein
MVTWFWILWTQMELYSTSIQSIHVPTSLVYDDFGTPFMVP